MLVLCNGMPKSGSSYLFKLVQDIVITSKSAESELSALIDNGTIQGTGKFVENCTEEVFCKLKSISSDHGNLIVKIHDKDFSKIKSFTESGNCHSVFSYREPRDCLISAYDHRARANGTVFKEYQDIDKAISDVQSWAKAACNYVSNDLITVKYEELIAIPIETVVKLGLNLGVEVTKSRAKAICEVEEKERTVGARQFNTGLANRYLSEMPFETLQKCNDRMNKEITSLGYQINS